MSISKLCAELRLKFSISPAASINRLILLTGEIVESTELLERGDRVWIELRVD